MAHKVRTAPGAVELSRRLAEAPWEFDLQPNPDRNGRWLADLSPVGGPILGPYDLRSEALEAEVEWLEEHWLEHQQ